MTKEELKENKAKWKECQKQMMEQQKQVGVKSRGLPEGVTTRPMSPFRTGIRFERRDPAAAESAARLWLRIRARQYPRKDQD
jgi:hypothetical protein